MREIGESGRPLENEEINSKGLHNNYSELDRDRVILREQSFLLGISQSATPTSHHFLLFLNHDPLRLSQISFNVGRSTMKPVPNNFVKF